MQSFKLCEDRSTLSKELEIFFFYKNTTDELPWSILLRGIHAIRNILSVGCSHPNHPLYFKWSDTYYFHYSRLCPPWWFAITLFWFATFIIKHGLLPHQKVHLTNRRLQYYSSPHSFHTSNSVHNIPSNISSLGRPQYLLYDQRNIHHTSVELNHKLNVVCAFTKGHASLSSARQSDHPHPN